MTPGEAHRAAEGIVSEQVLWLLAGGAALSRDSYRQHSLTCYFNRLFSFPNRIVMRRNSSFNAVFHSVSFAFICL